MTSTPCFCGCGRSCTNPSAYLQIEIRSQRIGRYWPIPFAREKCRDRWWKNRSKANPLFADVFLPTDRAIALFLQHASSPTKRTLVDRLFKRRSESLFFRDVSGWAFETGDEVLAWWRGDQSVNAVRCERTERGLVFLEPAPDHWSVERDPALPRN